MLFFGKLIMQHLWMYFSIQAFIVYIYIQFHYVAFLNLESQT